MATTQTQTCPEREDEVQTSDSVRLNETVECAGTTSKSTWSIGLSSLLGRSPS